MGNGRSAVEQTDWHDQSEQLFLTHLAQRLDADVAAGKTKSLIVVAPPRALGMIRHAYSHALRGRRCAPRSTRIWSSMPVHEIEKHLTA